MRFVVGPVKAIFGLCRVVEGEAMRCSTQIKPISYLKANAAQVLEELAENRQPLIITQNGEAKAAMQDLASYEATQETLALLKILALGQREVEAGQVAAQAKVEDRMLAHLKARHSKAASSGATGETSER